MRLAVLILTVISAGFGQQRVVSVCEALDSASDGEVVTLRGNLLCHEHGQVLLEPEIHFCHPDRYFNEPAEIVVSYRNVAEFVDFARRLNGCRNGLPLTVTGVFVRGMWWTRLHHYELKYRDSLWTRLLELYTNGYQRNPWDTLIVTSVGR